MCELRCLVSFIWKFSVYSQRLVNLVSLFLNSQFSQTPSLQQRRPSLHIPPVAVMFFWKPTAVMTGWINCVLSPYPCSPNRSHQIQALSRERHPSLRSLSWLNPQLPLWVAQWTWSSALESQGEANCRCTTFQSQWLLLNPNTGYLTLTLPVLCLFYYSNSDNSCKGEKKVISPHRE